MNIIGYTIFLSLLLLTSCGSDETTKSSTPEQAEIILSCSTTLTKGYWKGARVTWQLDALDRVTSSISGLGIYNTEGSALDGDKVTMDLNILSSVSVEYQEGLKIVFYGLYPETHIKSENICRSNP